MSSGYQVSTVMSDSSLTAVIWTLGNLGTSDDNKEHFPILR